MRVEKEEWVIFAMFYELVDDSLKINIHYSTEFVALYFSLISVETD